MNHTALFAQIVKRLRTTSELSLVIHSLETISAWLSNPSNQSDIEQSINKLPKDVADILIQTFIKSSISAQEQILLQRLANEILDDLRSSKSIQLTIAFQPDDATISLFSEWIKKNLNPNLLIDLRYDKSIVGGALIIINGIYKDYSVRKNLTNRFQIQREEILKLLE